MNYLIIQLILLSITFAIWNGYIILWGVNKNLPDINERRKKWSKIWHKLGFLVRFQIFIIIANFIYLIQGFDWLIVLKWELLYISIASILYDFIINLVRYLNVGAPPLLYVDNKGINAFMLKIFKTPNNYWVIRLLFILGTITLLII